MEPLKHVDNEQEVLELLTESLKHEWAVSLEYIIHAYSMPKGKYLYSDPVVAAVLDMRAQTIQIGIDEMYHALQMGLVIRQMDAFPTFQTDEVIRFPRIVDNLARNQRTEDMVIALYQKSKIREGAFPKVQNMFWNISYDEVRHSRQFQAMVETLKRSGQAEAICFQPDPQAEDKEEVSLLQAITRLENELMHRYLYYVLLFHEHQDLNWRLFKNSIDHMRHWDKNSGLLIKLGSLLRLENAERRPDGSERSLKPMPDIYPGTDRLSALQTLFPAEEQLIARYEDIIRLFPDGEVKEQLNFHLMQNREHLFTQEWLLKNARQVKGLA